MIIIILIIWNGIRVFSASNLTLQFVVPGSVEWLDPNFGMPTPLVLSYAIIHFSGISPTLTDLHPKTSLKPSTWSHTLGSCSWVTKKR